VIGWVDRLTRFERWGPCANPLIRRTLRQKTPLTLRRSLWIAFGIGLAGLAISVWQLLHATSDNISNLDWILMVFVWPFLVVTPFAFSLTAALQTRRAMVAERFELVQLTALSNETIVWALMFDALYGLRYALIGVVGLMPLLVIKTFHLLIVFDLQRQNRFSYYYVGDYTPPTTSEIVVPTLLTLGLIIGVWGLTLLGVAIGVRSAVQRRHTETAIAVAPFALLSIMIGQCMCVGAVPTLLADQSGSAWDMMLIVLIGMIPVPYVLVFHTMWTTAYHWQRRITR
jgi:hypothetical protein